MDKQKVASELVKIAKSLVAHDLSVGDILYSSWGYDQTNVSWYQIMKVTPKSVMIRQIEGKHVGPEKVVPVPNKFRGQPMVKRVPPNNVIRIESFEYAKLWDGKPKYETAFGAGH